MCRVSEQNNYITLQQGPECTTMTRELCLQAENTLHTGDGEWTEGEDFLVDEHKVHGSFRQIGRNNKVHWEKAEKRITHTHTHVQLHEILMGYVYWQATITSSSPSLGTSGRGSLCLTDSHYIHEVHVHDLRAQTQTHTHMCTCDWKLWLGRNKETPFHTYFHTYSRHWEQPVHALQWKHLHNLKQDL